jgi:hypothetical protein
VKTDLSILLFELLVTVFVLKAENKNRAINLVSAGLKIDLASGKICVYDEFMLLLFGLIYRELQILIAIVYIFLNN